MMCLLEICCACNMNETSWPLLQPSPFYPCYASWCVFSSIPANCSSLYSGVSPVH